MSKVATITPVTVAAVLVASFAFAGAPLPGFSLAAQTTHFSFYSRGAKVEAEKSEKYLTKVEQMLGASLTGRADYYSYGTPEEVEVATGSYASGVTLPKSREIHSAQAFHAHEIVHLVAGQMGDPGVFFQEGLAVALGNEGRWNGTDVDKLAKKIAGGTSLLQIIDRFEVVDVQVSFPVAGSFVRGLIRTYGLPKVSEFFKSCSKSRDREQAFERTFGVSIAQASTDWAQSL